MKTILVWLGVIASAFLVDAAVPFSSKEEKIPPGVVKETRLQIERYFGTNSLKGVPLLDKTAYSDEIGHGFRFLSDSNPGDVGQSSGIDRTDSRSEATLGLVNYS